MQKVIFLGINVGFGFILGRLFTKRQQLKFDFMLGNEGSIPEQGNGEDYEQYDQFEQYGEVYYG